MRVAVLGRTGSLLRAAELVKAAGHDIPIVWTNRAEKFYTADNLDFMGLAERCGAEFRDKLPKTPGEFVEVLAKHRCDVAISINWLGIIPQEVLDLIPLGVINAHAGDLPRYRGNACPNWAILAGEPHVGLCVHLMTAGLDSGPVILRDKFPLTDRTYIGEIYTWLEEVVPGMLARAAIGLGDGSLSPVPQDTNIRPLRCYPRRPEDSLIDWTASAESVVRLVRASARPFDGAYSFLGAERINIWKAEIYRPDFDYHAIPGQVCERVNGLPVIAAGDGMVKIIEASTREIAGVAALALISKSMRNRLLQVPRSTK